MIPKTLRRLINVHCHQYAQAQAAELRAELMTKTLKLLDQGYTAEQVSNAILVPCPKNNAYLKLELPE